MKPSDLQASSFAGYPGPGRELAVTYLGLLRAMPLSLLPSYLVQIEEYATLFPIEQERLHVQLLAFEAKPALLDQFRAIVLPPALEQLDWVQKPGDFVAALAGALWQAGEIDAYHRAAETLFAALPPAERRPGASPLLIAVLGREASPGGYPLFTRVHGQGMYLRRVDETGSAEALLHLLDRRAGASVKPYAHWYVDGGEPWKLPSAGIAGPTYSGGAVSQAGTPLQCFTYPQMAPVRDAVLREMDAAVREGAGPERLANRLREMSPAALALNSVTLDPRMQQFFLRLLTEGSGTQLYSTSFVQAASVDLLRRAQPETLMLRFAPRRRPANMNDMLEQRGESVELDPEGALIDADMALYYAWLAMRKQPGGDRAQLLAIVEGHGEAFIAGPSITRGVESETPLAIPQVLALLAG